MFVVAVAIALLVFLFTCIRRNRAQPRRRQPHRDSAHTRSTSDDPRYTSDNSALGQTAAYTTLLDYPTPDTSWGNDTSTDNCSSTSDNDTSCDSSSSDSCCDSSSSSD